MDKLIHTALNALHNTRDERVNQAQNLANMHVPGFRRDIENNGSASFLKAQSGFQTRVFQLEEGNVGFDETPGPLTQTGQRLDVAISEEGYFYMMPENGEPALSRRGDFRRDIDGNLVDGAGNQMLDVGLNPINLPPFTDIIVNELGEISVTTADGDPGVYVNVATIATVVPEPGTPLQKGLDGNIRVPDQDLPAPDQRAKLIQGALEGSNVNPIEEMIATMELQRSFEISMRMISNAKEIDQGGVDIMRPAD